MMMICPYTVCPKTMWPVTLACTHLYPTLNKCEIIIADDDIIANGPYSYELIMRHEMAHCLGWPPNHPNVRGADAAMGKRQIQYLLGQ